MRGAGLAPGASSGSMWGSLRLGLPVRPVIPSLAALTLGAALLAAWPASAEAPSGEAMRWEVHYLGVVVGHASMQVEDTGGGQRVRAEAHSADWYRSVYSVDDQLLSQRRGRRGSSAYEARYREGDWHHELRLALSTEAVEAERRQREGEGWRSWSDTYPGVAPEVEDPLSAFQRLRELPLTPGERVTVEVFDGKALVQLYGEVGAPEPCPGRLSARRCLPLALSVGGERSKRARLWLTQDAERLPAQLVVRSGGFSVKAELIDWSHDAR